MALEESEERRQDELSHLYGRRRRLRLANFFAGGRTKNVQRLAV